MKKQINDKRKLIKHFSRLLILVVGLVVFTSVGTTQFAQKCVDEDMDGTTTCQGDCRDMDPTVTHCGGDIFMVFPDISYPEEQCSTSLCQESHFNCPANQTPQTPQNDCQLAYPSFVWSTYACGDDPPASCPSGVYPR